MKIFMKKLFGVLVFFSSFFIGYQFWYEALKFIATFKDKISTELLWGLIGIISILSIILVFYIMNLGMKIIDKAREAQYPNLMYPIITKEDLIKYYIKRREEERWEEFFRKPSIKGMSYRYEDQWRI